MAATDLEVLKDELARFGREHDAAHPAPCRACSAAGGRAAGGGQRAVACRQVAPLRALLDSDAGFTCALVPAGKGEWLAVRAG